jgi:hypothetical protein
LAPKTSIDREFLSPMSVGRHGFGAATVGSVAYFAGGAMGCGGAGLTNELLGFTLPEQR